MIPICLVTGFLGSGKTTLLQRLVEQRGERRVLFLVNEFSPMDVDGARLELPEGEMHAIEGGSIFCRCKVSDFIGVLERVRDEGRAEGVVIEASGIANPKVLHLMLAETGLDQAFQVARVIAVVDPHSFLKLVDHLDSVRAQVEAADTVLLNKCDCHDEAELEALRLRVEGIRPEARLLRCEYCRVELDPFEPVALRSEGGEYALCRDPNYSSAEALFRGPVDWPALRAKIMDEAENFYRVKGFVPTDAGLLSVDMASGRWTETPLPDSEQPSHRPRLVFIARGDALSRARALALRIEANEFAVAPA